MYAEVSPPLNEMTKLRIPPPYHHAPVLVKHKVVVTVELFVACLARFLKIDSRGFETLPASTGK